MVERCADCNSEHKADENLPGQAEFRLFHRLPLVAVTLERLAALREKLANPELPGWPTKKRVHYSHGEKTRLMPERHGSCRTGIRLVYMSGCTNCCHRVVRNVESVRAGRLAPVERRGFSNGGMFEFPIRKMLKLNQK
jgi:hypothetical protein